MSIADRWLLPDGVEEVLPPEAARLEAVRRRLLDMFESCGYDLVITPMVEFLESLLTGTGSDLDLKTFKVTDQVSGRMMGVRADITPQVARIDSHSLGREGITRLCYAGTVLHAKADNMLASRTPISVGAELFGDSGTAGDLEIVSLLVEAIAREGIKPVHLELGDVGIFRELLATATVSAEVDDSLFELVQRKASAELENAVRELKLPPELASRIAALPGLCGGDEVIATAGEVFAGNDNIVARLRSLKEVADGLGRRFPDLDIYYDLSELRGYAYHTGIVFAAYGGDNSVRLGKGGRYDHVGEVFGRARAATGFDIDLKSLAACSCAPVERVPRVFAGSSGGDGHWEFINKLRNDGYIVIETGDAAECDFKVVYADGAWTLLEDG